MANTVRLHRVVRCPAEHLYRAFLDPAAMAKWLPPNGYTCTVHSMDAKVGGGFKASFTSFRTGNSHSFSCKYTELKPGQLIRYTDKFDDPSMPGEMPVTVTLRPVLDGKITELSIVQDNIPPQIPADMCYLGWQESLSLLIKLVEADVP
ncbi:MAG: SRPBCC family protein [Planctomycetota bacterium]|mgnify:CR=1 FL=1